MRYKINQVAGNFLMAGMTLRYGAFSLESVVDWSLDPGFLENGAKSLGHLI